MASQVFAIAGNDPGFRLNLANSRDFGIAMPLSALLRFSTGGIQMGVAAGL